MKRKYTYVVYEVSLPFMEPIEGTSMEFAKLADAKKYIQRIQYDKHRLFGATKEVYKYDITNTPRMVNRVWVLNGSLWYCRRLRNNEQIFDYE